MISTIGQEHLRVHRGELPWLAVVVVMFFTALCSKLSDTEKELCSKCRSSSGLKPLIVMAQFKIPLMLSVFGMVRCAMESDDLRVGAQVWFARSLL